MAQKIYFDTNQIYYIRRISEEAEGFDYGDYSWAYEVFKSNPVMVADIKALCYIISLQDQWDLVFCSSDAAYTELIITTGKRAQETRKAWEAIGEYNLVEKPRNLRINGQMLFDLKLGKDQLDFNTDKADRVIIKDFVRQKADVLLTSDEHILRYKIRLAEMGIDVVRPNDWINKFLEAVRGEEDGVQWVERILFTIGHEGKKET